MATLTLKISSLTGTAAFTDANALGVLLSAFQLFHQADFVLDKDGNPTEVPKTYTNQQKLDYIVQELIPMFLVEKARQYDEISKRDEIKAITERDQPKL